MFFFKSTKIKRTGRKIKSKKVHFGLRESCRKTHFPGYYILIILNEGKENPKETKKKKIERKSKEICNKISDAFVV